MNKIIKTILIMLIPWLVFLFIWISASVGLSALFPSLHNATWMIYGSFVFTLDWVICDLLAEYLKRKWK